eukprot:CAMPEP_0119026086 /NCGR_PEP_ID=MMETSP1176-20130426/34837_1 /TAXON_ID=265551 /ORGANISM="Synedropsis recta cf, Strain CCMP1620" /LENGTH=476 /DNA_ID=CAMNT_0006981743 /DNA_START=18 /DNA_END=1448 /DNA_ORIENTATION=+
MSVSTRKSTSSRKSTSPRKAKRQPPPPPEEEDDGGDELQAALAASQLATHSSGGKHNNSMSCNSNEVLYNDGATPLFTSIEETKWAEALELVDIVPEQAGAWVKSTGTENTTFGWSLWRRLPLHEACRRQAPAWLVAALLKAYPAAISQTTQFGELPIHLAVEMGAAPEVVNLLLVNYYEGIHMEDNGGRTAMTINAEADVLNIEDHTFVQESLKNAHNHLQAIEARWQQKLEKQSRDHQTNVEQIQVRHHDRIAEEKEAQKELQKQLVRTEGHVMQYKEERKALERTLSSHHVEKGEWADLLENKSMTMVNLTQKIEEKDEAVAALVTDLNIKTSYAHELENRVDVLERDLVNITLLQRDAIQKSLEQSEDDIQRMLASNSILQGQLQGQTQGLQLLLQERAIALPPPVVEIKEEIFVPDDLLLEDVATEAARAASAAINQAQNEIYEKSVYQEMTESFGTQEQSFTEEGEEKKD